MIVSPVTPADQAVGGLSAADPTSRPFESNADPLSPNRNLTPLTTTLADPGPMNASVAIWPTGGRLWSSLASV